MATLDQITDIVQRCLEDIVLNKVEVSNSLKGIDHVTVLDFGLDALDLVEIVMAVEDETATRIGDTDLEGVKPDNILIEQIPEIIFKAQEW